MTIAAAALLIIGTGAVPAQAKPSSDRCAFATMIGLRGSLEPAGSQPLINGRIYSAGGLGQTVGSLVASTNGDPNIPIHFEALVYPAIIADPGNSHAPTYVASVNIGVRNLSAEVEDLASRCPNTNILLAGFSQGADIINTLLATGGIAGPLSARARAHIAAVVMFGNPAYQAGQPWDAPGNGPSNGIFPSPGSLSSWTRLAWNSDYSGHIQKTIIQSYCLSGDFFCQTNLTSQGMDIHNSYMLSPDMLKAWGFIRDWLTDNDRKK